jgi:DNA-binding MarR family transcriptional regulator
MEVMGAEDLEPVVFGAIASVHDAPGIDHGQLAERIGVDLATARRIVKRLERRGFVERAPKEGSGHSQVFSATPAGAEILQRLRPAIRAGIDRVMAPLSDGEREMLLDLLARVIKARGVKAGGGSD